MKKNETLTERDVREIVIAWIDEKGNAAAARAIGVTRGFINNVKHGREKFTARLLDHLGIEIVEMTTYRRKAKRREVVRA